MAEALVSVPRRFVASTATSSSQWVLSPAPRAELRRARLAAAPPPGRPRRLKAHAAVGPETGEQPKWWEKNAGPNMIDIHSTQEFLDALRDAGDRLVIVEFYGTWCGSCRALFPRVAFSRGVDQWEGADRGQFMFRLIGPSKCDSSTTISTLKEFIMDWWLQHEGHILIDLLCRTATENPSIVFLKVNFDENKPMCKRLNVKVLPFFHFYRGADGQLEAFSCSLAKFQKLKDAIAVHNTDRCSIGPPVGVGNVLDSSSPPEKPAEATS